MTEPSSVDSALIGLEAQVILAGIDPDASEYSVDFLRGYLFALRQLSSARLVAEDAWGLYLNIKEDR